MKGNGEPFSLALILMNTSIADLFAARIADLKKRSDETNSSIQQHLASANQLITTLEEIDRDFPED